MDPKPPAKGRRKGAEPAAERSSHVIDLRQSQSSAPAQPAPPKPSKPAPKSKPQKPAPTTTDNDLFDGDVLSSPANKRRFWPAFARFLVLLIVLGLVVAGGIYLYVTYYQS